MSIFVDIAKMLDANLKAVTDVNTIPVAWENKNYKPVTGELYVRPTVISGEVIQTTLGAAGLDTNLGIYQVDIFAPNGKGKKEALVTADLVANQFKRGTYLTVNGRTLRIQSVTRQVAVNEKSGWFKVPVLISYTAHTEARV